MLKMKVLLYYISSLMYFIKCNNPVWKILFFEISGTILSFEWKNPEQEIFKKKKPNKSYHIQTVPENGVK